MFLSRRNFEVINICVVTSTRFSCCDDISTCEGAGLYESIEINFTYGSGASVENGGGEKYILIILIKGRGQNPRTESHDDILPT